jgi:hypothetical protein
MKKALSLLSLFFLLTAAAPVQVTQEGRSTKNGFQRSTYVFGRGVVNALASPAEIWRTYKVERLWHPKLWPVTYLPRLILHNYWMRIASAGYDIAIFPLFVVPFTNDIRPMSRYFDIPDYPWQLEVGEE